MFEKIAGRYEDELNDVLGYLKMADEAEDSTQHCIFRDIAKEEHEHAKMLKHLLEREGGFDASEELKALEKEANLAISKA